MRIEVTRGEIVESVHDVDACIADARGALLATSGNIDDPVFWRSTAKPFIAAAIVEAGAVEAFGLEPREIAVIAASHLGEPYHVAAVQSILDKIGMSASDLQCGVHYPYDETSAHALIARGEQPSALHNNCSGKHAGILAMCRVLGVDTSRYLELDHSVQQRILTFCARVCDLDPATLPIGVDGCGIPVFATSLHRAATAFARLASPDALDESDARALRVVGDAMVGHPAYVAGTSSFDTALMDVGNGDIVCKLGAEGVHGVAVRSRGLGIASKVRDGTGGRARPPVTMAALRAIDHPVARATQLESFAAPVVYNRAGRAVGAIRVAHDFAIEKASTIP